MRDGPRLAAVVGLWLFFSLARAGPVIHWGRCPRDSGAARSAAAMRCGWLHTGAVLAGHPLRLRVVVLQARPDERDPTPIIYLPGGPGEPAGLDGPSLTAWRAFQQRAGWAHDIVLFDPRGTGASRPRPDCALDRAGAAAGRAQSAAAAATGTRRAVRACYARLGAATAAALGPAGQLADLDALITALGVRRVNVWAVSYGSRLALLYARRHPARVHAMVLDSPVPFSRDANRAVPAQIHRALVALDVYCAAHPRCARRGKTPRAVVFSLLRRYQKNPPAVAGGPGGRRLVVTPYRLLMMLLYAGYAPASAPDTIARLRAAAARRPGALAPLTRPLWAQQHPSGRSRAVFWSTRCAFRAVEHRHRGPAAYPKLARLLEPARFAAICAAWPVPIAAAAGSDTPLTAPTLLVSGTRDILTPPAWAAQFARTHPKARLLRVFCGGHRASATNACAQRTIARFWNAPSSPVATHCAAGGRRR